MQTWTWFLSFRDAVRNVNLGGCTVQVEDDDPPNIGKAAQAAWDADCNPGGEVMGFTAEGSSPDITAAVLATPRNVLLTRDEVAAAWAPFGVVAG